MQYTRKTWIGLSLAVIVLLIIALIFWLKPQDAQTQDVEQTRDVNVADAGASPASQALSTQNGMPFASPSQQDVQINCQLKMDASNRLIVNEGTKNCFEFFITQYGEKTIEQIKTDFVNYAKASYQEPLLGQLTDLWTRYIQYREQLGSLEAPNIDKEQAGYYKAIFSNMKNLRKKFFSNYEIEGLFGIEDIYNDYTLARMAVLDDKSLTATEKAKKLKELFEQLPEDWKENLKQLSQLEDLRKLTAEIKARGGSPEELRQMRTQLVGAEATQRLESLDTERSNFKSNVSNYLNERDSIIKSNMSDAAKEAAIQQLRSKTFSNPQEQLRLQTFESLHDQGGKLPFAD
ncbi:lipase secretion chaperone [Acinetobacter lanii]|uniref:Lipase chaperone n=1 Tax=Acinetobacter lanii TaxID=2715163 RepID=A0A6G8S7P4_9GAMM|nr:lipase secretion chaperone [Acinetobacter lanii]QIO09953.1 lipase secretion chaperone [Acinetobacter lanii]